MPKESPTARLANLKDRKRDLNATLETARVRLFTLRKDEADARLIVGGYERSTRPHEMTMRDEAQARLTTLREQVKAEADRIAALEGELAEVKAGIAALFEGQAGHAAAVSIYREAKARIAAAETALRAHQAKQETAARTLEEAQKAHEVAIRARDEAMDDDSIKRARVALEAAQQAEADARTLVENLQRKAREAEAEREAATLEARQARQKAFEVKAALLAEALKQRLTGPVLEAFAAARLAGSGWGFREWLAEVVNPEREHMPAATDTHRAALVDELEAASAP